ncbi:MAG: FGGY-family carbohydrate kinase [Chloroflexota bacterium]
MSPFGRPPPGADRVLALDVGTQSVRALLFDPAGTLIAASRVPIEPYVSPHPGWAENDPAIYWEAIRAACRGLWTDPAARPDSVAGLALTAQRATIVVADQHGTPLRPAIVWLDQRRTEGLPPLGGLWGLAFRALGVRDTVAAFQADADANWISRNEPEVWSAIRQYGLLSAWLVARLTGRFADSSASQVGYLPFDFRRSTWAAKRDWKWQVAPFERDWLPELVPPTGILGQLTGEAAAATGLLPGLPVVAAAGDKQCEALGAGALPPNVAALSFGSTATIATTQRRYVEAIPLVPAFPAALPGAWSTEVQVYRGYWMVEWFKRQFGAAELAQAVDRGIAPEALFDELVDTAGPGSAGLVVQPYWSPGVRRPGPEAKGAIIGFGDVHTRAHVYRAILEGLAYALREGGEHIAKRTGVPITELRVSGGGAQSRAAVQLTADVFGLPAVVPHTHETSGLGAAIDAMVGLGIHRTIEDAVAAMTRVGRVHEPDPATRALYDDLYGRVYKRMYPRLRPLYADLRRILSG